MTMKQLYIVTRPDGGTTITPLRPDGPYELGGVRLIAGPGLVLAYADDPTRIIGPCLDITSSTVDLYTEVQAPPEEEEEPT